MSSTPSLRITDQNAAADQVTVEIVRHVAALANLELTPAEEPGLARDLNAILAYIAQLNELDTTGVEPMAQVAELLSHRDATTDGSRLELREDRIAPSVDRAAVLREAPETDGRFFKVPRVLDR